MPQPSSAHLPARSTDRPSPPPAPRRVADDVPPTSAAAAEPALSLLEVLLRHPGKLVGCVVLALALGVTYQLLAPRVYESSAEVFVERSQNGKPNSALAPGGVSAGQTSTHASLLASTPVLRAALADLEAADTQTLGPLDAPARLRLLQKNLSVSYSKELETLAVRFRGPVRQETPTIVNAVVTAYLRELGVPATPPHSTAPPSADALSTDAAASSAASIATAADRGVMSEQMIEARLMSLAQQLAEAQVAQEAAGIRVAEAAETGGDLSQLAALLEDSGLDSRAYGLAEMAYLRNELARLEQQMQGMPRAWGPEHAVRGPLERQAQALRRELTTLQAGARRAMVALLESSLSNAQARVAELDRRIADEQAAARQSVKPTVRVLEWGEVPHRKAAPRGVKSLGVALVLGLLAGGGLVLWSELRPADAGTRSDALQLDDDGLSPAPARGVTATLRSSDDVQDELRDAAPPLLGMVPEVPSSHRLTSPSFDATASSIHQIRAVLQVHATAHDARAFAFTSPRRGAGKTSVTIGVASSLAMSGTRTLVVDCDLAGRIARGQTADPVAPAAGERFGPLDPGDAAARADARDTVVLEEGYLSEDDTHALARPVGEAPRIGVAGLLDGGRLEDCVVQSTVPHLSLLPATHAQTRHIGMMSDAFIRRLIAQAQGHYDVVLFDSGPVPGSVEALLVTSQVDGVVVVVPQGESRDALSRTMSYLKVVEARVFGTVFNRAAPPAPASRRDAGPRPAAHADPAKDADPRPETADRARDERDQRDQRDAAATESLDELERQQAEQDQDDGEFLAGDAPLGSGILAAAVFSDAESGYASQDWKLQETSEFHGSVDDLFGKVNGQDNDIDLESDKEASQNQPERRRDQD